MYILRIIVDKPCLFSRISVELIHHPVYTVFHADFNFPYLTVSYWHRDVSNNHSAFFPKAWNGIQSTLHSLPQYSGIIYKAFYQRYLHEDSTFPAKICTTS